MNKPLDKNKAVLGLSGGVDSTTAALLLKEQGFDVTGVYFDISCGNEEGIAAAKSAADQIGIDFIHQNVSELFSGTVIENFCSEYLAGRTPNPCVLCNPTVKFKVLIDAADEIGAYYIATGHYAKTFCDPQLGWMIKRAGNEKKDQSYMLHRLPSDIIQRLLLPLSDMGDKEDTRKIARENSLSNADKKDSQEICFINGDQNYADYIREKGYPIKEGNFIDKEGNILGRHKGLINYTIGQRKGLGITFGKPVFVTHMDAKNNTVTLGEHEDLFSKEVICKDCFFPASGNGLLPDALENAEVLAKIRYAAKPAPAVIHTVPGGKVKAVFREKQRAATPGQSMVFYLNDCVIGGGYIEE